jgi:hypothetical protein
MIDYSTIATIGKPARFFSIPRLATANSRERFRGLARVGSIRAEVLCSS